ncbi:hypothetical protein AJ79_08245 [Helicocarpus griseus UAMH5409]|uniref:NYN domain-containing protein n=1 Tax=Helicocarpus griseus UAMH5409 TaxID=1447875 RepID=A0A2B7WLR8_9EURO|nr:hypothetical protein AJ79_08245 [Helicocarpus griseus UAMH5409]
MSTSETSSTWDFGPVITFLNSFPNDTQPKPVAEYTKGVASLLPDGNTGRDGCRKLGDFGALFDLLSGGRPLDIKEPGNHIQPPLQSSSRNKEEYQVGPQDFGEEEAPAEATDKPSVEPKRVRILLKKSVEKNIQKNIRVRSGAFPISDASDDDVPPPPKPRPAIPISILKNPNRPVDNNHTVSTPSPKAPAACRNRLSPTKASNRIEPLLECSPTEKRLDLISKLSYRFPSEQERLSELPAFAIKQYRPNIHPSGVHVFVDMSNISVGFHDCIKMARDIPITVRVPRVPLSFHNFCLILERGRPTSKRVLVGSDRFPAIDAAEEVGYEINILERVQKVKDCTPRKKKFLGSNGNSRCNGTGTNAQSQYSGSETNAVSGLERWVEQGVDEILHLKILESLVDTDTPSTIVLATGDAAEAEYSDGFLKMVERALQKGWSVELVSFSTTTSHAYKRKEFRSRWGDQFKVIKLDDYVEHLLDA